MDFKVFSYVLHDFWGEGLVASTRFSNGFRHRTWFKIPAIGLISAHTGYNLWPHPGQASFYAGLKHEVRNVVHLATSHQQQIRDWKWNANQSNWNIYEMCISYSYIFQVVLNLTVQIVAECTEATKRIPASNERKWLLGVILVACTRTVEVKIQNVVRSWLHFEGKTKRVC